MKVSKKNFLKLFNFFWPFIIIVGVIFLFFWRVFIYKEVPIPADIVIGTYYPWLDYKWGYQTGVPVKNPITTDVVSFVFPMQSLAVDLMKKGEWPLWNPYILAGTPLLANFQSAPFSPTVFLYFIFDKFSAWSYQIILQHLFAALFTYFLLREWKCSKVGSTFGGLLFAFGGFNIIWSQWNGHALSASFIPLIVLFTDRFARRINIMDGIGLSLSLAGQILSGYPQVVLYSFVCIPLIFILRVKGMNNLALTFFGLMLFLLLGLGLSSLQIIPGKELLSLSQRETEPHPYEWAFLPYSKVITFLAPDYYGNHATQNYWGPQDYTSNTGFVGVVGMVLATVSLLHLKRKKEILWSLAIIGVSLLLSFPTPASVLIWKSGFWGLQAASAHRILVLFNLGVALLAGWGLDYFINSSDRKQKWYLSFLAPTLILGGFFVYSLVNLYLRETNQIPKYLVGIRNLAIPIAVILFFYINTYFYKKYKFSSLLFISIIFILFIVETFKFGWKFTPFSKRDLIYPKTPVLEFLSNQEKPVRITGATVIPINLRMPYGIESLEGYDAIYPEKTSRFLSLLNSKNEEASPIGRYGYVDRDISPLLDLANVKFILAVKRDINGIPTPSGFLPQKYKEDKLKIVFEDRSVAILQSKRALPRAFMVYDWENLQTEKEFFKTLINENFSFDKKVLLNKDIFLEKEPDKPGFSDIKYIEYKENKYAIKIETSKPGILVISDIWYPGWKAFVDGRETEVLKANYIFRAIQIDKGEHLLEFFYRPNSFFTGLKISVISIIICLLIIIFELFLKTRLVKNKKIYFIN